MLVEINLLPQKEASNRSLLLLAIILSALIVIGGIVIYWLNRTYENQISSLEQEITATEQLVANEQQKMVSYESSNSLVELENTVKWAADYPLKTVPVLHKLTALLPERGFVQTFAYEEIGIVKFSVQFETSREAAFFLNSLLDSDWVETARLNQLNAVTGFYDRTLGQEDGGDEDSSLKNEKYIPRYLGEYEVTLNRDILKEEVNQSSSKEQGGDDQ